MFLKYLKINKDSAIIREIKFRKGINLIVDESRGKITGNSVGKTTVLKLIDFCFGVKKNIIWEDPENKKLDYEKVKSFLIQNEIIIILSIINDFDNNSQEIILERNFLNRNKAIRKINGENFSEEDYKKKLKEIFFPEHTFEKPTFRQIISHNIRYDDLSLTNTLRTLDRYTSDVEYEALHLFLLGCEFTNGNIKQEIIEKIKQEDNFKKRLERNQTKSAYEVTLQLIDQDIKELNIKKKNLNINENFENDLDKLNNLKYRINKISSEITNLNLRRELILEASSDLNSNKTNIDVEQLKQIYNQAKSGLEKLQKSFEELVNFHNQMLSEKIKFINKELPQL